MEVNPAFWKGKRVLLTGHTGFKGSWLSLWLQSMGAQVVGYALAPPTNPSLFEVAEVGKGMTSIIGDIRDLEHLRKVFAEHQPEIVIHMAAQALVRYSYVEPVETYSTNVMGTVNLLEAVRSTDSVKAVVNVTSDKCYENREWVWGYRENEAMGGYDPYSNSKGCAELVTAAYRNSYFHPDKYQDAWRRDCLRQSGQRHRRRRLGGRQAHPGHHARHHPRQAGQYPQPACHPSLAACAGAAVRLSGAGAKAV